MAGCAATAGMASLLDVVTDRVSTRAAVAAARGDLFERADPDAALDPRRGRARRPGAGGQCRRGPRGLVGRADGRLAGPAGVAGFRLLALSRLPAATLRAITRAMRRDGPCLFLGWTPELKRRCWSGSSGAASTSRFVPALLGFPRDWLWRGQVLRRVGCVIACAEEPFGARLAGMVADAALRPAALRRAARFAAAFGDGWLMPMGFELAAADRMDARRDTPADLPPAAPFDLATDIRAANEMHDTGAPVLLSGPGADAIVFRRASRLTLAERGARPARPGMSGTGGGFAPVVAAPAATLAPAEVRNLTIAQALPVPPPRPPRKAGAVQAAKEARIGIEAVSPLVEGGRFAATRIVGEAVTVEADVVCEGHDQLGVALRWRAADETAWRELRMQPLGNDRWRARFALERIGRHLFTIEAWRDAFATFRDELGKKHDAGIDIRLELQEGRALVEKAAARVTVLRDVVARLRDAETAAQVAMLLAEDTARLMAEADERPFAVRLEPEAKLDSERRAAGFAGWYEMFPRSMSDDEQRHGTFADVIRHLPRIRDMGFDVLYFPPIHPIGRVNRKGRNNSAARRRRTIPAAPTRSARPKAATTPSIRELGTLEDFRALLAAAREHGLEMALDFAIQCAPDHPWLAEHPDWFAWRPDGSHANTPKTRRRNTRTSSTSISMRQGAVPGAVGGVARVVLFWVDQGVRIFRVDNPHTKPLPFWEWMIAEIAGAASRTRSSWPRRSPGRR